jgi:hypothetical protein
LYGTKTGNKLTVADPNGRSLAVFVGSNPAWDMDVYLVCMFYEDNSMEKSDTKKEGEVQKK